MWTSPDPYGGSMNGGISSIVIPQSMKGKGLSTNHLGISTMEQRAAAGFSEGQLLRLAGYYQTDKKYAEGENPGMLRSLIGVGGKAPYGDEPDDQAQIRNGIQYYRRKFVLKDCQ